MVRESEYSESSKLVVVGVFGDVTVEIDRWESLPVSWESKGTLFLGGRETWHWAGGNPATLRLM